MPKFKNPHTSLKPESEFDKSIEEEFMRLGRQLEDILDKGIKFADNFNGQIKSHTSNAVANTEDTISHTLGRVPSGYLVLYQDKAGTLYQGPSTGTAWTASNLYLKCNVASVAFQLLIF